MKNIKVIFWLSVAVFLLIIAQMFVPCIQELLSGSELFLFPFALFTLLGIALLVLTLRAKMDKKCRKFLTLASLCAIGVFVFVVLHNVFYAFAMLSENISILKQLMEYLHVVFFVMATIVCPLGYVIGAIGSVVLMLKKSKKR